MACIHKLNKAISFGCTGGQAGIEALYLVNRGDIKSLTRDYTGVVTDIVLDDYPGDADNLVINGTAPNLNQSPGVLGLYPYRQPDLGDLWAGHDYVSVAVKTNSDSSGVLSVSMLGTSAGGLIISLVPNSTTSIKTAIGVKIPVGVTDFTQGLGVVTDTKGNVFWAVLKYGSDPIILPHSIPVDCYRNGVKLIETLRTADVGDRLEQTLSITLYNKADTDTLTKLVNGSFVAFVKMKELGAIYAVGLNNGLEISSADMDSSANGGFTSISLKTPDGCVGEQRVMCSKAAWDKVVTFSI